MSLWHSRHKSRPLTDHPCGLWQSVQEASLCSPFVCNPPMESWHSLHSTTGLASNDLVWQSPQSEGGRNPAEWQRLHRIRLCFPASCIGCQGNRLSVTNVPIGKSGDRTGWVWQTVHSVLRTFPVLETCRPSWQRKQPAQFRCPMLEG